MTRENLKPLLDKIAFWQAKEDEIAPRRLQLAEMSSERHADSSHMRQFAEALHEMEARANWLRNEVTVSACSMGIPEICWRIMSVDHSAHCLLVVSVTSGAMMEVETRVSSRFETDCRQSFSAKVKFASVVLEILANNELPHGLALLRKVHVEDKRELMILDYQELLTLAMAQFRR